MLEHTVKPGKHTVKLVNEDADVQKKVILTVKSGQDVKIVETFLGGHPRCTIAMVLSSNHGSKAAFHLNGHPLKG